MAPASSSALRDDSAADGLGYGSLTGIGGPKKFKKKPVLVLDPEELEAAHAMFEEASAELCGGEVERPAKPATVLGLAPMLDDDPEEMGASDEDGAEDDDTPVDTEAVLSLTRRKSNAMPIDEYFGDDLESEDIYGASAPDLNEARDGSPLPDEEIEDGLDLSKRIFPSLNLAQDGVSPPEAHSDKASGAVESASGETAEQREETAEQPAAENPATNVPEAKHADAAEQNDEHSANPVPKIPLDAKLMDYQDVAPEEQDLEDDGAPTKDTTVVPDRETDEQRPRPARFDELNPNRPTDDEDVFDLDAWLAEEQAEPVVVERPYTYEPRDAAEEAVSAGDVGPTGESASGATSDAEIEPVAADSPPSDVGETPTENGTSYTVTGDDNVEVDGLAFMRNEMRSRPMPVSAQQAGQQNALRARLAKEERQAEPQIREIDEPDEKGSLLVRLWNWLRGLFS